MKKLLIICVSLMLTIAAYAVPASPRPIDVVQPNGDTLTIRLHGDERHHWRSTLDGVHIVKNKKGYYCYSIKDKTGQEVAGRRVAHNEEKRSRIEKNYIKRITKKYFKQNQ